MNPSAPRRPETKRRQSVMPNVLKFYRDHPNQEYSVQEVAEEIGAAGSSVSGAVATLIRNGTPLEKRAHGVYLYSTAPGAGGRKPDEPAPLKEGDLLVFVGYLPNGDGLIRDENGMIRWKLVDL